ncbi:hypothetical protein [Carbonactinospora thermoautotrophica]|uniref:hypothetical protein n=1 Tax=Carbonactinospora thermoautotrophica TaxID=1469144 RepID=UPI002271279C|nr:hypothetical protein [Carbonactinospora thermoautotrophica]
MAIAVDSGAPMGEVVAFAQQRWLALRSPFRAADFCLATVFTFRAAMLDVGAT